jgi:general secretion pathway protein N
MRWTVPALGLTAFAVALAALAPATLIDARLERASAGRLRLAGAQGSVWSGAGWIEIRGPDGRSGVAKHLAWRVLPGLLLRGRLTAEVELDQTGKPFPVTISLARVEIDNAGISLPAAALGLGMPGLAPFRLSGEVRVDIPHLSLERGRMDGDATLQWRAAGSALTPLSPLGDYEVRFKAAGSGMQAVLRTLEGPLQLEGQGAWSNGGPNSGPPGFLVTARVPAQHQEQLAPLFRLIGVERGAGTFELRLK